MNHSIKTLIFLLGGGVLLTSCGKVEPVETENSVRPVKVIVAETASGQKTQQYPAVINVSSLSQLSFSVSGKIEELPVKEAQIVNEGDLIARLEASDFQSKLDALTAQFQNAKDEYERAERLAKQDAIAKGVVDQRKAQLDSAKAQMESAQKGLNDTVLTAPFDGIIASIDAKPYQNIQAGALVAKLMGADGFEAVVNVPASVIASAPLQTNNSATVIIESMAESPIKATFSEATLEADTVSQTYRVTFSFVPPKNVFVLPGMNATVVVQSVSAPDADQTQQVVLPLSAILSDGTSRYVWVIDQETMTVSKREVQVADGVGEALIVLKGLQPGDHVVGAGASYLSEGQLVRPWLDQ